MDAIGYLRRFIDFEYSLAIPEIDEYIKSICEDFRLDDFFEKRQNNINFQHEKEHLINGFMLLAKVYKMSLRETEQIFSRINLALCATNTNQPIYPSLLAFLAVVREKDIVLYENFINPIKNEEELIDYLHKIIPLEERDYQCALIEAYLILAKLKEGKSSSYDKIHVSLLKEGISEQEKAYYTNVLTIFELERKTKMQFNFNNTIINSLAERINMLSKFNSFQEEEL